jgi:hypothetical protein
MGLQKDRTRIHVRGLGNLYLRELEPSEAADFSSAGYIKGTTIEDVYEMEDITPETGERTDRLEKSHTADLQTNLEQSSLEEIELIKLASGKVYAARYFGLTGTGRFQYFNFDLAKVDPNLKLPFAPGERLLPFRFDAFKQDLDYDVPVWFALETNGLVRIENLMLWVEPRALLNTATTKILDLAGFYRHGDLSGSGLWLAGSTPLACLRFDGTDDTVDFGDILDDDASGDFVIECWLRIQGANGTQQEVLSKKAVYSDDTDGFAIVRASDNTLAFKISDAAASATISSSSTVLINTWKHCAIAVDRNGGATWYINGAAAGSGSVAAVGNGTNGTHLLLAACGANFGQVDLGGVRLYRFAAGGLPSWASVVVNHYNAEKGFYGL